MNQSASITDTIKNMISQSIQVLTKRDKATFEQFENKGTVREAVIYVLVAALITGLFGLAGGIGGFISSVLTTVIGFLVFSYLVQLVGKSQGGTGTFDQVAYTLSLIWAPLSVIFALVTLILVITLIGIFLVPLVAIAYLVVVIWLSHMVVQTSMNISDSGKAWITLVVAAIGSFIVNWIIGALFR